MKFERSNWHLLSPAVRIIKWGKERNKPYKSKWHINKDLAQPLYGIAHFFLGLWDMFGIPLPIYRDDEVDAEWGYGHPTLVSVVVRLIGLPFVTIYFALVKMLSQKQNNYDGEQQFPIRSDTDKSMKAKLAEYTYPIALGLGYGFIKGPLTVLQGLVEMATTPVTWLSMTWRSNMKKPSIIEAPGFNRALDALHDALEKNTGSEASDELHLSTSIVLGKLRKACARDNGYIHTEHFYCYSSRNMEFCLTNFYFKTKARYDSGSSDDNEYYCHVKKSGKVNVLFDAFIKDNRATTGHILAQRPIVGMDINEVDLYSEIYNSFRPS